MLHLQRGVVTLTLTLILTLIRYLTLSLTFTRSLIPTLTLTLQHKANGRYPILLPKPLITCTGLVQLWHHATSQAKPNQSLQNGGSAMAAPLAGSPSRAHNSHMLAHSHNCFPCCCGQHPWVRVLGHIATDLHTKPPAGSLAMAQSAQRWAMKKKCIQA